MSSKMLRHAKVANYLVGQAFRGYDAVVEHDRDKENRADRGLRIAGHLIIVSSCDLIDEAYDRFRFSARMTLNEARREFQKLRAALPGIPSGVEALFDENMNQDTKSKLLKYTIKRLQESLPKLIDLSESVQFLKDGKYYYALADATLYTAVNLLLGVMKRTKFIDRIKNSNVSEYARIGSQLEKDLEMLEKIYRKTESSFDDFDNSEMVVRVAGEQRNVQIISA